MGSCDRTLDPDQLWVVVLQLTLGSIVALGIFTGLALQFKLPELTMLQTRLQAKFLKRG